MTLPELPAAIPAASSAFMIFLSHRDMVGLKASGMSDKSLGNFLSSSLGSTWSNCFIIALRIVSYKALILGPQSPEKNIFQIRLFCLMSKVFLIEARPVVLATLNLS